MSHLFPSAEWAKAYQDAINANPKYKEAGKIDRGVCKDCHICSLEEAEKAPFVIVADYARWKTVLKKELDPIKGMMQNKLKLTKGHMPTMIKYVNSSRELVETTAMVDSKFRDE